MEGVLILGKITRLFGIPLVALFGVAIVCWLFLQTSLTTEKILIRSSMQLEAATQFATSNEPIRLISVDSEPSIDDLGVDSLTLARPVNSLDAAIEMSVRVGLDPSRCAEEDKLIVEAGTIVVYCYYITNIGTEQLIGHTVLDLQAGLILPPTPFDLAPELPILFTTTRAVNETTTNFATWTAFRVGANITFDKPNPDNSVDASSSATVYVPTFAFTATVGVNQGECAKTTSVDVLPGTPVYYCYIAVNTSGISISLGALTTGNARTILQEDFAHTLAPGERIITYGPDANIIDIEDRSEANTSSTEQLTWFAEALDSVGEPTDIKGSATTKAQVNVANIEMNILLGLTSQDCEQGPLTIDIAIGPKPVVPVHVVYCYTLTNNGKTPLRNHQIEDRQAGILVQNQAVLVNPGVTIGFNITKTIFDENTPLPLPEVLTNTITWRTSITESFVLSTQESATVRLNIIDLPSERLFLPLIQK